MNSTDRAVSLLLCSNLSIPSVLDETSCYDTKRARANSIDWYYIASLKGGKVRHTKTSEIKIVDFRQLASFT